MAVSGNRNCKYMKNMNSVKDELTAIMRRFDLDGDAKLTYAEFAEALSPF